jgi:hypothetical protein
MPTLTSNAALKQSHSSAIERWLTGATRSYVFLLAFFAAGISAAVVGFSHRPGGDVLAYPLFVWSPFLLILGVQQMAQAIRNIRDTGVPMKVMSWALAWRALVAIGLCAFAWYVHSTWSLFVLLFAAQQLTQGVRKTRDTGGPTMATIYDGAWLILMAIGLFSLAIYIHSPFPGSRG